jgi:large subunit ribosomal protein L7/L12
MPADLNALVATLDALPISETAQLVPILEQRWGVSAKTSPAPKAPTTTNTPVIEVKTEFDVYLTASGDKKINVIKEVRTITGLGLKEAKDLVESATAKPMPLKLSVTKAEADALAKQIKDVGGTVEIQ